MTDTLAKADLARNLTLIGHSDQGGRPDGVQLMVNKGYAITGHMFSKGFSVIDVRNPRAPEPVAYIPAPPNTWNIHLQTHEDLLLVINAKDLFASSEFADEKAYYTTSVGKTVGIDEVGKRPRDWTAGMSVYDIKNPVAPREIGFMPVEGAGIHRIWYTGGRYAYASALLDGFADYMFITIDMADPTKPREVGRWWIPGMHTAGGEVSDVPPGKRYGLHHAIIHGDTAYAAWRDAGMVILDIADRSEPKLIRHMNWSPPYGGGTHNCLPLPERELLVVLDEAVLDHQEDGVKHIWIFNNAVRDNPISIATVPQPDEDDYVAKGGHFGPHNLYENRPDGFVSEELIFTTFQNAGIRVFSIADPYRPVETAAYVPGAPERLVDHRPNRAKVIQSCDVYVDKNGLVYANDYNGGLYILEYSG
ncbi:hypothetical protein L1787_01020 [Acuticoccus sp. M5D2P5]|uniref:LVIVD repeat-containing protein n=1 Tax=Acuticoccus kalidii TaxID=2910977 RepID=UPI001F285295|nr:hypothetical protein [Acuticoccus kalidii]MCF3931993.1 hypothetical protein [Acuticoccus kalidii]